MKIDISKLKHPDYRGSVQNLFFLAEHPGVMVCETTPGGSVFDVGTIFSIPVSDLCRAALRHKIYNLLASPSDWEAVLGADDLPSVLASLANDSLAQKFRTAGAHTHHMGLVDEESGEVCAIGMPAAPSRYVVVKKYTVMKPERIFFNEIPLWDYSAFYHEDKFVIPLENIVRFGMTPGSSVYRKYLALEASQRTAYVQELGLRGDLQPWQTFPVPIIDFTTKYEPEDRNLSLQEALYISGCDGGTLLDLRKMALLGATMVSAFFRSVGLQLWDLKWEIAKDGEDLVFVDTIDTDSVRVTLRLDHKGDVFQVHFNKQAMRDYYKIRHADWYAALGHAKNEAKQSGKPFHEHLESGVVQGRYPPVPEVEADFLGIQSDKFSALLDYIRGKETAAETATTLQRIAQEELHYYERSGQFEAFCRFNRV